MLKKLSSLTLLKWDSIMDIFLGNVPTFLGGGGWGGVCIPIRGNIPLRGNAVYILLISSERIGNFKSNFAVLIQVSIETF